MLGRRGPPCHRRGGGERVIGVSGGDPPGRPPPALAGAGGGASLSRGLVCEDSRWRRGDEWVAGLAAAIGKMNEILGFGWEVIWCAVATKLHIFSFTLWPRHV
jgi:hypothetical protein